MRLFSAFGREDAARDKRRAETARQQASAADPAASAWVSANAGTGKTHVLTMRVLRLLLAGTPPERILALTYTKAAAAEMSKRVFARLAEWVMAADAGLRQDLARLLDRSPHAAELQRARRLFAVAIETPGGLKVQTIHAFCERLLQRFPLEAGVPPGFAILDDHERRTLLAEAADEMLAEALADKPGALWASLRTAIAYAVDERLEAVLAQAFADRDLGTERLDALDLADVERGLRRACGVRPDVTMQGLTAELAGVFSDGLMPVLAEALRAGSKRDTEQARHLQTALAAGSARGKATALQSFFLTQDQAPRQRLMTQSVSDRRPDLALALQTAQGQFVALHREH
jgi:ATP-dependent helicase/nuclease subunit A